MRPRVPSLFALKAFESAARHLSFTRAAEELNLTQSAISRHIRLIEDSLGVRLFHRAKQRISLTEAGEVYVGEIRASLTRIETSTLHLLTYRRSVGTLNLATLPTFGAKWLVPRLPAFHRQHPGILINFILRPEPFEFVNSDIDAAIYFGTPVWPGIMADRLMGEKLVPVCSPALLDNRSKPIEPQELARYPLLQLTVPDVWDEWFRSFGLPRLTSGPASRFEHFTMGIEAAACGLGILLVPHFLVADDIRAGRLVIPYPRMIRTRSAYYFICPESKKGMRSVSTFRDWILRAARETDRECDEGRVPGGGVGAVGGRPAGT
jgi:LysR family glycine cleavage system transcriptional activator